MNINELRDEMVKAVNDKHPRPLSPENQYINLMQQVTDFGELLQHKLGVKTTTRQHNSLQHQIGAILVDVFVLSKFVDADVEKEVLAAIEWFKTGKKSS